VFFVSGAMGLPLRQFARWDLLGLVITVPAVVALGYEFGDPLLEAVRWTLAQSRVVLAVALLVATVAWYRSRAVRSVLQDADDALEAPSET
jgi:membrane protein DedA with SNARE-associated domain